MFKRFDKVRIVDPNHPHYDRLFQVEREANGLIFLESVRGHKIQCEPNQIAIEPMFHPKGRRVR